MAIEEDIVEVNETPYKAEVYTGCCGVNDIDNGKL